MSFKVVGGTPKTGRSLCLTCKRGKVIRGQECQEMVFCTGPFSNGTGRVPFRVAECGDYHPSTMPWLHEMEDMAWKIEARKKGAVGFSDPENTEMEVIITKPKSSNTPQ